jgi:NAD(P)H dehydrogenase (quinone)
VSAAGRFGVVTRDDTADALVAALDDPRPVQPAVTREVTWADLAAERGQRLVDVAPATYLAELAAAGEEPWWCYAYASLLQSIAEGRWEAVAAQ